MIITNGIVNTSAEHLALLYSSGHSLPNIEVPPTPPNSPIINEADRSHETTCWKDFSGHFPRCLLSEYNTEESRWCLITYLSNRENYLKFISNYNELAYNWGHTHTISINLGLISLPICINFDDMMEEVDSSDNDSGIFDSNLNA